jgi:hypothetical protein
MLVKVAEVALVIGRAHPGNHMMVSIANRATAAFKRGAGSTKGGKADFGVKRGKVDKLLSPKN